MHEFWALISSDFIVSSSDTKAFSIYQDSTEEAHPQWNHS